MRLGPLQDYNVKNMSNFLHWKIKDSQDLDQYCPKQQSRLLGMFCDLHGYKGHQPHVTTEHLKRG